MNAPRITPADIEDNIIAEHYFNGFEAVQTGVSHYHDGCAGLEPGQSLSLITFCVLMLRNGYTVAGHSACASPENYNEQKGRDVAREHAFEQVWPLMGYQLKSKLADKNLGKCS